ncbi:MAG: HYExAFE family protein [Acidobacteria bacterium]|nr:HYExAFE family protein [Planctomycetota bacterium]MBE3131858.1 HYExAFE family protein [Acidobacteriota bacterium]
MANRKVIYEACFEDYLRTAGVPYVAVDEAKKALFAGVRLKSFDFVVYSRCGPNLLVDVKGRRFPSGGPGGSRRWENWATREDLDSLARWEEVFGSGFAALLVFCYHLGRPEEAARFEVVHAYRGESYGLIGVTLRAYAEACRTRSRAWDTVTVPAAALRRLARPVSAFF